MPSDRVVRFGGSTVQHGPGSNRVYLMHLDRRDCPEIIPALDALAEHRGYTKIFAKVPAGETRWFLRRGYDEEARVPGFFGGGPDGEAGAFLAKYLSPERGQDPDPAGVKSVIRTAMSKGKAARPPAPLPPDVTLQLLGPERAEEMAALYARVFASYPFPIHDPAYIRRTMELGVAYCGALRTGKIIGLASADPDFAAGNVEMTDFAVSRRHRGLALARHLLTVLEKHMAGRGVGTHYTIARARSHGMNVTFARQGYEFAGTLTSNTNIAGGIESMNVWYRHAP